MYMLDTNIIVKAIRQKNHPVRKKLLNHINGAMHHQHHLHGIDVRCLSFTGSEKESIRSLRDSFLVSNSSI